jgi:hypothetical protein
VKIEAILLANAAAVNEHGLLVVDGGGWRYIEVEEFPGGVGGSVCGVVELEPDDFGSVHAVALQVFDDAGQVDGSSGSMVMDAREVSAEMSSPRLPFAIPFMSVLRGPTVLNAKVTSNGGELAGLSVIVRRKQLSAE